MVDYIKAIKRPFLDIKKSGLAALLVWIPIVNFLTYGYFLECAKLSLNKQKELPEWGNLSDKFVKGLLFIAIKIIYAIPLIIISLVFMGNIIKDGLINESFIRSIQTGNGMAVIQKMIGMMLEPNIVGIFVFAIIVGILVSYLIPMAVMFYVTNWKFKDAFNFKEIYKKVLTKEYFSAWILVSAYSVLLMSVGNFIPLIGGIIASALAGITGYTVFGEVYREIKV